MALRASQVVVANIILVGKGIFFHNISFCSFSRHCIIWWFASCSMEKRCATRVPSSGSSRAPATMDCGWHTIQSSPSQSSVPFGYSNWRGSFA